jgi:hypothetical protein
MFQLLTAGAVGRIARYAVTAIGVGIVSYVGVEALLSQITGIITSQVGSVGGAAAGVVGLMGIPEGVSMITSAYAVRIATAQLKRFKLL